MQLFALSLQTSALNERPHEIKGTLSVKRAKVKIVHKFLCTCKAGNSGQCKHIAAVLIVCTRENILDLPQLSSTDLKCYWTARTAGDQYTPAPLLEQECLIRKMSPRKKCLSQEDCDEILQYFTDRPRSSSYGHHRGGRRKSVEEHMVVSNLHDVQLLDVLQKCGNANVLDELEEPVFVSNCCQVFYNTLKEVDIITVATATKSSNEVWHNERQFRITGSRCYSVYTYGMNDWETKSTKYFWPKSFKSRYTTYGVEHEAAARVAYCQPTGDTIIQTGLIVSQKQPWLAYSPDGIILEDGKPSKLLEIKCPYSGKTVPASTFIDRCTFLKSIDGVVQLKTKHAYYAQIQLGMAILNLTECSFVVYASFDNSYISLNITYDYAYSKLLLEKLHFNYFNKMLHFTCLLELK